MGRIRFGVWAAMALILVPLARSQSYTITDLGTLGGGNFSIPGAINNSGVVVGWAALSDESEHAFVWTSKNGMRDIGTLGGPSAISAALGINKSGEVVGYSYLTNGEDDRAFVWTTKSGMQDLGTLGGSDSEANGINDAGQVVGCASLARNSLSHAFLWTSTAGMQDLGTLGGNDSCALGINQSGQIVGYSYLADNVTFHAFIWTQADGMKDLGNFDGTNSYAWAINTLGEVAGNGYTPLNAQTPVAAMWTTSRALRGLGAGPGSLARAINDSGQIVGSYSPGINSALLWTPNAHAQNLGNLIPPDSGWSLYEANSLNNTGQIVAFGNIGGQDHAALLTPAN